MSKKKIEPESEQPENSDNFGQFVKGIFSLTPDEVQEILDEEKEQGIPPDPDAEEPSS